VTAGYTPAALRAFGTRPVTLRTLDGATLEGRIVQDLLGDAAAVLLFAADGDAGGPLVVPLESIESVRER